MSVKTGVVHNPNNWHWVDKNCLPWSKTYFETNIVDTKFEDDKYTALVTKVKSVSGDCDVTQRKGRTRCIYDMVLEFKVTLEEKENDKTYEFDIVIPEFVHDQPEDEYEFQINGSDLEYKKYVRNGLVPLVKTKLIKFQPDLINEFDPQIKHNTD